VNQNAALKGEGRDEGRERENLRINGPCGKRNDLARAFTLFQKFVGKKGGKKELKT